MSIAIYLWVISFFSVYLALLWILVVSWIKFEDRRNMKNLPTLTIAIPMWNEGDTILTTLRSLAKLDYPKGKMEVILVDDGSSDNTFETAMHYAKGRKYIKVLRNNKNFGKGKTLNKILKLASGKYFAVFDADSTADRDLLKKILSYFTNDSVAAVASQIKVRDPRNWVEKIQRVEMLFGSYIRRLMMLLGTQHFTNGVMSVFRTDILRNVGGFNTRVMTEDFEIAVRLRSLGYDVRICEDAYGYTKLPTTFRGLWVQRVRWYRGFIQTYLEHRKMIGDKSYGLLGLFQLPLGILTMIVMLVSIFFLAYEFCKFVFQQFLWLIAVQWDIFSLRIPSFSEWLWGLNFKILFPSLIAIGIGIFLYQRAHKHSGEKVSYAVPTMLYIFAYPILLSLQLWHAMFAELFHTKRRWR